jgi:hypothetical protein
MCGPQELREGRFTEVEWDDPALPRIPGVRDYLAARAVILRAMEEAYLDPGRRMCARRLADEWMALLIGGTDPKP